ncbi:unnamed protein product [Rhizophagus irregularis]|uniref:Uncharacterized protein n=1 Tax=Rhizophagus irregularis TaxID=588596 RepID=A0A916DY94_9GLOM|nr:unnamed protein product [Rhizophagus irregularis]CAB5173147.1 unnamed protein product [Rhizophagus irregularis]CAB5311112.1 unnamed protein product [Rhizophagus irregularis]CAG8661950.1 22657_t:CDS:2 [Rhizophagus irregularis]
MVSALPEKLLEKISSMPVLCVQFNGELKFLCICNYFAKTLICYIIGASTEIYLDNWSTNMRPIVFSIMELDIPKEVTALSKLAKVAAKMLSLRSFK